MRTRVLLSLSLVVALAVTACTFSPRLARIVLTADATYVHQGASVHLTVKGFDSRNRAMSVSNPAWSVDDPAKGTLQATGASAVFTAAEDAVGSVVITVVSGTLSDTIEIHIVSADDVIKVHLEEAIAEAEDLLATVGVGTGIGQAPQAAHSALQAAINSAKAVLDDDEASQGDVDAAVDALRAAIAAFKDQIVVEPQLLPYFEEFDAADAAEFLSAEYRSIPNDPSKPMYVRHTGSSTLIVKDGVLELIGGRFTIGKPDNETTTSSDTSSNGIFDLTKPYRVVLEVVGADTKGNLQVYVDNNTTSAANSMHGEASRLYNTPLNDVQDLVNAGDGVAVIVVESNVGTPTSFITIRTDGGGSVKIRRLVIEYY